MCDNFKPKHYFDQLCYETNLQELKDSKNLRNQLEFGLTLVLDYNEERQMNYNVASNDTENSLYRHANSVSIFLNTISMEFF